MLHFIGPIIGAYLALLAGKAIYKTTVKYINRARLQQIALANVRKSFDKIVVEAIQRGNVGYLELGIFSSNKKTAEIKITAEEIYDDIKQGDVLYC